MIPNITFVIQGLAFFAVVWLVMKFGWPHIIAAIEERQQKIAEGLAAADRAKADALLEAARVKATAQAEIDGMAGKAREALRNQVSTLAVQGASKILQREINPDAHKALLDQLVTEI